MSCPAARVLSRYYDELVEGSEREQIEQHVTVCAACQQVLTLYRAEARFIEQTLRAPHLPESFEAELLQQIRPRRNRLFIIMAMLVIMSVILFLIAFLTADVVS